VEGTGHIRAEEPSVTETPRLGIGQKARFVLRARVPVEMSDGFTQAFEIKATSKIDPSASQAAPATLVASAPSLRGTVLVDRTSVKPGDSLPKETLAITLVRSPIGTPKSHRIILRGLGLRRLHHTVIRPNTPQVKGLVHKLAYLLEVREAGGQGA
jgi:large subunit ribosomal protein L30